MGKKLSLIRMHTGRALAALVCAFALSCAAGEAYLPLLGPIPLRMAVKSSPPPAPAPLPPLAMEDPQPPASPDPATVEVVSNQKVETSAPAPVEVAQVPPDPTKSPILSNADAAPPSYAPATVLRGLTAQFLAEYLRPAPGVTNAVVPALLLPTDLCFVPPVPQADNSSRASYKTQ